MRMFGPGAVADTPILTAPFFGNEIIARARQDQISN